MGSISQNVSNVNTIGYKRKETDFKTVLSETHAAPSAGGGGLDVFGVKTADRFAITAQGVLTPSDSWSDMAINGRGFFIVSQPTIDATTGAASAPSTVSMTDAGSILYTRAGDFREYAVHTTTTTTGATTSSNPSTSPGQTDTTYLTTPAGQFLMGWKADAWGRIQGEYTSCQTPVPPSATATTGTTTTTTTSSGGTTTLVPISWQPNMVQNGAATTAMQLVMNLPANMPASTAVQTKDTTVKDLANVDQTLRATWTRTAADTWSVGFSLPNNAGINIMSAQPITVTMDGAGNISSPTGGTTNVDIDWDGDGVITAGGNESQQAVNLTALKPTQVTTPLMLTVYDNSYNAQSITANFERWGTDSWAMTMSMPSTVGTLSSLQVGTPTTPPATPAVIPITFDGAGNLVSPTSNITMGITWAGATAGTSTISIDESKLTQLADDNNKIIIKSNDQDGYGSGMLSGTYVSDYGEVIGKFSNGRTRTLYKIPVATFAAPNLLDPISGTLFRRTQEAGDVTVDSIDDQGSGAQIMGATTEASNVKIEDEFTKMIITQKAYSTNAEVFKTCNEMTQSVRDLIT
jgi:flagellar hook protein FlgE